VLLTFCRYTDTASLPYLADCISEWQCIDDRTINIVMAVAVTIIATNCAVLLMFCRHTDSGAS